jgi:hypothetical protein
MRDQRLRCAFDERLQLAAVAGAELDEVRELRELREDLRAVTFEEAHLCARDRVPREFADRVEQRRAERVVEIHRRQLPWRELQTVAHIFGKCRDQHRLSHGRTHLNVA